MRGSNHVEAVVARVEERLTDLGPLAASFARLLWSRTPDEDLAARNVEDDAAASLSAWQMFAKRKPSHVDVRVMNPVHARDGWQSQHTVVLVLLDDSPFVVDSVLMALSHGSLVTHFLGNVVYGVERADSGALTSCHAANGDAPREVMLYAEVDRVADDELTALKDLLQRTLRDVGLAVSDFGAMKRKAQEWFDELSAQPDEASQEAASFIAWLMNDHFTFLGYREFRYADDQMEQIPDSALGVLRARSASTVRRISEQPEDVQRFLLEPVRLSFSKSGTLSRVHRPAYPDYVGMRILNEAGEVVGEHGFLGLYTSRVYLEHTSTIPIVRRKVDEVMARSGLDPSGFDGKVLAQVLATYPRDELLQIDVDALYNHALDITYIHERRKTRAFFRHDRYGLFVTCQIYLPRDLYNTQVRQRIQALLVRAFEAEHAEFQPYFSESILVRLQFTLRIPPGSEVAVDHAELEQEIVALTRDWQAELATQAVAAFGEARGRVLARRYGAGFPAGYREEYSVRAAVADIELLEQVGDHCPLVTRLFRQPEDPSEWLRLKVFHANVALPLSDVIPSLENMGLRVLGEMSHMVTLEDSRVSIQDFQLRSPQGLDLSRVASLFEESFEQIWHDRVENDRFNQLTLRPGLTWRQTEALRAYARYNKQLRFGFSLDFMADTLCRHPEAAIALVDYFEGKFDPQRESADLEQLEQQLNQYFDSMDVLNEDRFLRRFLELLQATVRTNYFSPNRGALALKLQPRQVAGVPKPAPEFEVFVCAPHLEGVHLRAGAIARGGLRWSDRLEDYRTEVLGLVKAQAVKNAVIVPVGAKGGFVVKRRLSSDRAADGVRCYQDFIDALLSVTDNLDAGAVQRPEGVRAWDEDDPYLVVAADKGTATFSDLANERAQKSGFWLGDAFASGGSNGYDHKKMGITARGAWVSVQRHFAERGTDVQSDPVSVLGIGDMAGDVFGNGMLLSRSIELVAAFNHLHVFIDPNPDAAAAFDERQRLFSTPGSRWSDYQPELISAGGGVFDRSAKQIEVSAEMAARFDLSPGRMSPEELIHALLKSPVDLIWNGGIGTYVKAAEEPDDAVGDRANDGVRVCAHELRCGVFGEGGNLGLTQKARIAFALSGGGVNTDFIDNSAGVDCSDHEVNIKILLGELVAQGDLTVKQRNVLLEEMTEEVAGLVLSNNQRQAETLSLAVLHSQNRHDEYRRLLDRFERDMALDRELESLPGDEALSERFAEGLELTRPELAVLLATAKMQIKQALADSSLLGDPHLEFLRRSAFPNRLAEQHADAIAGHRLANPILATQIANDLVHHAGVSFVMHLSELVGGTVEEIVRAYLIAAATLNLREHWREVQSADVEENLKLEMLLELMRLARRVARWFLRHQRNTRPIDEVVSRFGGAVEHLANRRRQFMSADTGATWQHQAERWVQGGVPSALAERTADAAEFGAVLPIIDAAAAAGADESAMAARFSELGHRLELGWLTAQLGRLPTASHWQAMERDSVLDEVTMQQGLLAAESMADGLSLDAWFDQHPHFQQSWSRVMSEVRQAPANDFSMFAMTCRKLTDLSRTLG